MLPLPKFRAGLGTGARVASTTLYLLRRHLQKKAVRVLQRDRFAG